MPSKTTSRDRQLTPTGALLAVLLLRAVPSAVVVCAAAVVYPLAGGGSALIADVLVLQCIPSVAAFVATQDPALDATATPVLLGTTAAAISLWKHRGNGGAVATPTAGDPSPARMWLVSAAAVALACLPSASAACVVAAVAALAAAVGAPTRYARSGGEAKVD